MLVKSVLAGISTGLSLREWVAACMPCSLPATSSGTSSLLSDYIRTNKSQTNQSSMESTCNREKEWNWWGLLSFLWWNGPIKRLYCAEVLPMPVVSCLMMNWRDQLSDPDEDEEDWNVCDSQTSLDKYPYRLHLQNYTLKMVHNNSPVRQDSIILQ